MKVEKSWLGDFYHDANRSGYWERAGWDLLIDYDYAHDVPGAVLSSEPFCYGPVFNQDGSTPTPEQELYALEIRNPLPGPDVERCRTILTKRLARAGYEIAAWEFLDSTNGWHLKIRLNPSPAPVESVALQAVCGSDPLRESCNIQRAREVERWARDAEEGGSDVGREAAEFWRTRWNVLYQPKPESEGKP